MHWSGGHAGAIGCYECTVHDGISATLDTAGLARQTCPVIDHTGPALAYQGTVPHRQIQQYPGTFKVMYPSYPEQYQLPRQPTGLSPPVYMAMDPVHVSSWSRSTASWVWAPSKRMAMGLPSVASAERWPVGFTPEAQGTCQGMRPPVVPVGGSRLTYAASLLAVMSVVTVNPV